MLSVRALAGFAAVAVFLCLGCARSSPEAAAGSSLESRIVVMAPVAAEILDALELDSAVVGVGDFVTWPRALAGRPKVGAYDRPNLERILALRTTLYITTKGQAGSAALAKLRELGVDVLEWETGTLAGVLDSILEGGARCNRAGEAHALVQSIRSSLSAIHERARRAVPRRTLVVVGRDPLFVAGPGSYLDELVTLAGGRNVAEGAGSPYPMLSLETVLERRPDVVLDTSDNRADAPRGNLIGSWGQWPFLPAVAARRVFSIHPERLAIPGPRLPEMAALVARMIHPEIFGEPAAADFGPLARADGTLHARP